MYKKVNQKLLSLSLSLSLSLTLLCSVFALTIGLFSQLGYAQTNADVPYCTWDYDTDTLTFKYGEFPGESSVTKQVSLEKYSWNCSGQINGRAWNDWRTYIETVSFEPSFQNCELQYLDCWFLDCTKLTNISGGEYVNTSQVTSTCLLYTSPSPRDGATSRMPSSA